MRIGFAPDGSLEGTFYNTAFMNGQVNDAWGDVVIGFSTADSSSSYAHSGRLVSPDRIEGQTFSPERSFVMPWRATRARSATVME
jgi:hypothetical protein